MAEDLREVWCRSGAQEAGAKIKDYLRASSGTERKKRPVWSRERDRSGRAETTKLRGWSTRTHVQMVSEHVWVKGEDVGLTVSCAPARWSRENRTGSEMFGGFWRAVRAPLRSTLDMYTRFKSLRLRASICVICNLKALV